MTRLTPDQISWLEDELLGLAWGEVRIIVENGRWKKVERTSTTRAVDRSLQRPLLKVVPEERTAHGDVHIWVKTETEVGEVGVVMDADGPATHSSARAERREQPGGAAVRS